ncbi:MAG TPA: histidine kinase [Methylophilaceae bacterium]|nr:histidine kinase [Methylophilaceae bacterium]HQR60352.1 histidine kinase [Methylophilaceae bacterium]
MASIKQNLQPFPVSLPDFRNMGVNVRIMLLAIGMTVIATALRAQTPERTWLELVNLSSAIQPLLLLSLLVLYALNAKLSRLPYAWGVAAVFAVELALVCLSRQLALRSLGEIEVAPLWHFLLFTAIMTGVTLFYFNLRYRALSPAITEARLQALQARIRPHFLFNSINAVLSLIRSDPKRAETALEDMADLFRVLMADNRKLVPLHSELDLCRQYLALEKLRLGERLQLAWHIDDMPGDALIPPLLLQPLLENAVYHGIEPLHAGGEIDIRIYRNRNEVHLVLTNPYHKESDHHNGNNMALSNIRERLSLHFDAEAQLTTHVTQDQYQIHIVIPYREAA